MEKVFLFFFFLKAFRERRVLHIISQKSLVAQKCLKGGQTVKMSLMLHDINATMDGML